MSRIRSEDRRWSGIHAALCAALGTMIVLAAAPVPAQLVTGDVEQSLAREGTVDVIVNLKSAVTPGTERAARRRDVRRAQQAVLRALAPGDLTVTHRYQAIPALAGRVTARGLEALRANPAVELVELDALGHGTLAQSVPQISADIVHGVYGFTGAGVTVAVLDTGIDTDHPDLADSLDGEQCFCSSAGIGSSPCCPNGQTSQSGAGAAEDDQGHGTHVTGIVTSNGTVSPVGVAPDADVVAVKVINSNNITKTGDVIAGLDWIIANRPDVDAVNMSLCFTASPGTCDKVTGGLGTAVNTLAANGVAVFASSGNQGFADRICRPGCVTGASAVGSVDLGDDVVTSSNSGTELAFLAPGDGVTSTYLSGGAQTLSGTSMASPHAMGAAALLLEAFPTVGLTDLLAVMAETGVPILDPKSGITAPRVDTEAAHLRLLNCGNGTLDGTEECDDGAANGTNDCCSATCFVVDPDEDGICSRDDNCPDVANPGQEDVDTNDVGDVCEPLSHYLVYKAKASPRSDLLDNNKFPRDWNLTLDDTLFDNGTTADDPENYLVKKERGIANPAMKNDEPVEDPDRHYLRYQLKRAKQGIGPEDPPASGVFPKAEKAPKRLWHVENQFGDVFLETKKVTALWLPAGKAEAPGVPSDPGDANHFICYQAKASKVPSAQAPDAGGGTGKFRKNLQAYFSDQFDDCAFLKDGVSVPFPGTPVEAKCLLDLKKPAEICSPAAKSAVVPPRDTSAVIAGSTPNMARWLLCYKTKLTTKVLSSSAAALGGVSLLDVLKQQKHVKRKISQGTQVNTLPGNLFPRPENVDTKKLEFVCVPSTVLSVTDL